MNIQLQKLYKTCFQYQLEINAIEICAKAFLEDTKDTQN